MLFFKISGFALLKIELNRDANLDLAVETFVSQGM
jgi:hypothetical protein